MNPTDKKILELSLTLKQLGVVKSQAEFCREIGFMKQNIRKVKSGAAHFSLEHLANIVKVYNVDANYIVGNSPSPFLKPNQTVLKCSTQTVHKSIKKGQLSES